MSLNAGEVQSGGQVRDPDGRRVVVMEMAVGSKVQSGGQVRDSDGRCVVKVGP